MAAIAKLKARITELESQVAQLQEENNRLKAARIRKAVPPRTEK